MDVKPLEPRRFESKKTDYLDSDATPLNLEQLKLLKPGDKLIMEDILPDNSKDYTRGIVHEINVLGEIFFLDIGDEIKQGEHNCTILFSTGINSSGNYKLYDNVEKSIYLDLDVETYRHYSPQVRNYSGIHYDGGHDFPFAVRYNPRSIRVATLADYQSHRSSIPGLPQEDSNNTSCTYNARSPYLGCTVHPSGSCDGCKDFEPVSSKNRLETQLVSIDELPRIALEQFINWLNEPI